MPRRQAALAAAVAFACALALASSVPGLADTDPWSHLQYAKQLCASGLSLRGHPFLPLTVLGDSGVDPWWGFHLLLLPFTSLDLLWGARLAGAAIAACVAGSLAWLLCRLGRRVSWPFAVAPLVLSATFALRGHVARPAHLTIPLLLIELACGLSALPAWAAGGAAFAHGLLHLSSPLSPMVAALGALAARLASPEAVASGAPIRPVARGAEAHRPSGRAVLWSIGGLALALLARPDRALYLPIAALHDLLALGLIGQGRLPHTGLELFPPSPAGVWRDTWAALALLALAALLGRGRVRSGSPAARLAALLFGALCLVLTLRSLRFIDYLLPALALAAGLLWPREPPGESWLLKLWNPLRLGLLFAGAALLLARVRYVGRVVPPLIDEPATYARIAREVRARVPAGELVFTDDPFVTEVLYGSLPEYRYLLAYDPAFLYLASPALFWRWHHAATEGAFCDEERCPAEVAAKPSGAAVARVLASLGAEWAVTSYPRGRPSAQEAMASDPARFDLVLISPGSSNGLYLWHRRR